MAYGFSEVEGALAQMHAISESKRRAFVGRLQHIQKQKFPPGINTGRGRAARYLPHHVFLISMVTQLNELGIPPEKSIKLVLEGQGALAEGVMDIVHPSPSELKETIYCHVPPAGLEELSDHKNATIGIRTSRSSQLARTFAVVADKPHLQFRVSLFSLSGHVIGLPLYFRAHDGDHQREFWNALKDWADPLAKSYAMQRAQFLAEEESEDGLNP